MSRVKGSPKTGGKVKGSKHKKTLQQEEALKYIQDRIRKELEPILDALIEKCKDKDMSALKEALDRLVGKPKESIEHSGEIIQKVESKELDNFIQWRKAKK